MCLCRTQDLNVYDVVKKEKLVVTVAALAAIQERLVSQNTHEGKRRSLLREMANYQATAKKYAHVVEEN